MAKLQQMNPMAKLQQLKSNPIQFLAERGGHIPQGMTDPFQMINHLMKTGQISQTQLNKVVQTAQTFMR